MNIQDFATRWALHYVNPDFLKIPINDGSKSFMRIHLCSFNHDLKEGGYGVYEHKIPDLKDIGGNGGYLIRKDNNTNKISYILSSTYTKPKKTEFTYDEKQYFYYFHNTSVYFIIERPGTYYFMTSEYFEYNNKGRCWYNNEYITYDLNSPAPVYKIVITNEIFEEYKITYSSKEIKRNQWTKSFLNHTLHFLLYHNYKYWTAIRALPCVREDYTAELEVSQEWVTKNGALIDTMSLYGASAQGYNQENNGLTYSITRFLEANIGHNYKTENFDIEIPIEVISGWDYVGSRSLSQYETAWRYYHYTNELTSPIVWHHRETTKQVQGKYLHHQKTYNNLYTTLSLENGWYEETGPTIKSYAIVTLKDNDRSVALSSLITAKGQVLEFDDGLKLIQAPSTLDQVFSGWSNDYSYNSYEHKLCKRDYDVYYQERPGGTEYHTGYPTFAYWMTPKSEGQNPQPQNPDDKFYGKVLFSQDSQGVRDFGGSFRSPCGPCSIRDDLESFTDGWYTAGPQIPRNGIHLYSGTSIQTWNSSWSVCSQKVTFGNDISKDIRYSSQYWLKTDDYNALYTYNHEWNTDNNKYLISYTYGNAFIKKESLTKPLSKLTVEDFWVPYPENERKKLKPIMHPGDPYPQADPYPVDNFYNVYTNIDGSDWILNNYENLSQDIKDYLGDLGAAIFAEELLQYAESINKIETEFGKCLNEELDPKDVL